MRFLQIKRWLQDRKKLVAALNEDETLKKALFSPVRQPIEGSRYKIGDCLSEYLPGGETRRYKICGIQNGGLANVYTVVELNTMKAFCLKENRATFGNPQKKDERLEHEAEISRRLGAHPNLVALRSVFRHRSRVAVVYEYVAGRSLDHHLRRRPLDVPTSLRYAADLCCALVFAGEKIPGFVHGDIKPANCLITDDGRLKLADFGHAAERAEGECDSGLINARRFGGTYAYMAPELFTFQNVDRRLADVYAFGATLFEMLTGIRPVSFRSREELIERHRAGTVEISFAPLEKHGVPPPLTGLIAKCLDQNPQSRPGSFAAIYAEIERIRELLALPPAEAPPVENAAPELGAEATESPILAARDFIKNGEYRRAHQILQNLLRRNDADVAALNLTGETLLHLGEPRRAAIFFRQAICFDKWQKDAYEGLCRSYLAQHLPRKACQTADMALQRGINEAFFYEVRGNFYKASREYARAVESYKKALIISKNESAVEAFFADAVRLLAGGAVDSEIEDLLGDGVEILKASNLPDERKRLFAGKLINLPVEKNKLLPVLFALDDALVACLPKISGRDSGVLRERLQKLVNFAARHPLDFDVFYAAGKIFYDLEHYDDCEHTFRLSLEKTGAGENAFYYLGACRELAGDWRAALKFYQSAHRLNRGCEFNQTACRRVAAKLAQVRKTSSAGKSVLEKSVLEVS